VQKIVSVLLKKVPSRKACWELEDKHSEVAFYNGVELEQQDTLSRGVLLTYFVDFAAVQHEEFYK